MVSYIMGAVRCGGDSPHSYPARAGLLISYKISWKLFFNFFELQFLRQGNEELCRKALQEAWDGIKM